jgi:mycofactocin system glycosyltransferase
VLDGDRVVVHDADSAALARLLLDRGLADPVWDDPPRRATGAGADGEVADRSADRLADERAGADVTVVVPVRDRPEQLARLLAALPRGVPVVVVDDGSRDAAAVASVARAAGAELVVHEVNRGPAAARNTGLRQARTAYVALVDSDVVPDPGWLAALRRHFEDPAVAAVGPRVRGLRAEVASGSERSAGSGRGWLERYEAARSPLDLGPTPAAVRPHGRVAYLPSATLVVRREAWVGGPGAAFDEDLRVAEDVDAVWRVCAAGWRVRYAPEAVVRHDHRTTTGAWLARRAYYGSGAALLAQRHGPAVAPVVLTPWTTALTVAALAQRRWSLPVLGLLAVAGVASTARRLGDAEEPVRTAATVHLLGAVATAHQTAAALTRHHWPLALGAALVSRRARRAWVVAAVVQGLVDHRRVRPDLDPVRHVLALRLDDLAYGAGVWAGAWRARSPRALLPRWRSPGPR